MNDITLLPDPLKKVAASFGHIQFVQKSDLLSDRSFGTSYLVVTDRYILVAENNSIVKKFDRADIQEVKVDELVGAGRLSVVAINSVFHLITYTAHFVPHFAVTARYLSNCIKGLSIADPEEQKDALCKKCGAPLPERGAVCALCVPKIKIIHRLVSLTAPYKGKVIFLMIVTALGVGFQIAPPLITKHIIDDVIIPKHLDRLYFYIGLMIAVGVGFLIMRLINIWLSSWISGRIVADLRDRLHTVVQYLQLNFFNKREPGEVVGRIMHDTGELQQFLVEGVPFLLINTLSFIVVGIFLLKTNWQLTCIVFFPVPFLVFGGRWFWSKLTPLFHREGSAVGHMNSMLTESLQGLKVVKAFAQEQRRTDMFSHINEKLFGTRNRVQRIFGSFNETMFWVMQVGVVLVWFFSARKITTTQSMTLGDLMLFIGCLWLFYGPLQWFSAILNWMSHAFAGAERIFEIIDSKPEAYTNPNAITLPSIQGSIEFKDVRFSYERGKEVLHGVSFSIAKGEVIGLVGKSGAGKSTVINLLSRFFEVDSGEVLVDGVPIKNIDLIQLRKNMGVVLQEPFLFNATIAQNIAYGMEHATFSDIVEAAKAAYAHEFICKKDDGYDTMVGESGTKLSGGEKQRISIARAILHNPPILILDEATSSVDATTEKHIQEAINRLIKGRTTIAIAHRLSTLRNANRLFVLDDGKIAETGTHDQLMKADGLYKKLADAYMQMNSLQSVVWGA